MRRRMRRGERRAVHRAGGDEAGAALLSDQHGQKHDAEVVAGGGARGQRGAVVGDRVMRERPPGGAPRRPAPPSASSRLARRRSGTSANQQPSPITAASTAPRE